MQVLSSKTIFVVHLDRLLRSWAEGWWKGGLKVASQKYFLEKISSIELGWETGSDLKGCF